MIVSLSASLIASLIACRCPRAFHIRCLNPPLACVPEGDWYCLICVPGAVPGAVSGEAVVGRRIEIHWPLDEAWYEALVSAYDDATKRHEVRYVDDDVVEALDPESL